MLMDELRATEKLLSNKRVQKHANMPSVSKVYDMSFDGGWFVADYNVTAQVRSLI